MYSDSEDEFYAVERIIGKKRVEGKVLYKVKWKGFRVEDSTWESLQHLRYVPELIYKFESTNMKPSNKTKARTSTNEGAKRPRNKLDEMQKLPIAKASQPLKGQLHESAQSQSDKQVASLQSSSLLASTEDTIGNVDPQDLNKPKAKDILQKNPLPSNKNAMNLTKKEQKFLKSITKESINSPQEQLQAQPISEPIYCLQEEITSNYDGSTDNEEKQSPASSVGQQKSEEQEVIIRIRSLDSASQSDLREYVVEYGNGNTRIFTTHQLIKTHVFEFVDYLQKKAHQSKQ